MRLPSDAFNLACCSTDCWIFSSRIDFSRSFINGTKFGFFATFTDVSTEEFGEGSFDKGIRGSIRKKNTKNLEYFLKLILKSPLLNLLVQEFIQ